MASTESRHPNLAASEAAAGVSSEAAVVWPDPSPLDAWWRRIMHSDPVRRGAA
ncbi:hypothetical protein [Nocardia implantans]|uniref:Uncharacterized protein n=1 Tax=Nocardia implantans TaxID=3108168 RepID=A0ABU6AVM1_9NOCA|nr:MULTISPECIES: hypothetical protein [unclassified Nocardia]MBF6192384.1 hypothetical protein [Nocardia beijingensis]MEA3527713.1 hypothetical protein [Nocardia sp. CDC192]MEB3511421.1 hypothetical protein [Nocardia sp. CDC186]